MPDNVMPPTRTATGRKAGYGRTALTVTDQFCGAGGSSIGAVAAGAELRLAMNHWKLAIDTHNSNFPNAAHACADISSTDPRRFPSTDILITSPECTNHTSAKGKKRPTMQGDLWNPHPVIDPAAERSRATMWDVPRFAEHHGYKLVVVENVVEARQWVMWDAWLMAMHSLGYDHQAVYFNSMHAPPVPQSRDRMYVVFWRRGNRQPDLEFRPAAHCIRCERIVEARQAWKNPLRRWGKYRAQYVYVCGTCTTVVEPFAHPAAEAIDWALPSQRIGDRERPLAPKTLARIRAGIERFWPAAIVQGAGHTYEHGSYKRAWSTQAPLPTQMTTLLHGIATAPAFSVQLDQPGDGFRCRRLDQPLPTQTARLATALVQPPAFITELRGGGSVARSVREPLATVTASGNHHGLVTPPRGLVVSNFSPGWVRDADAEPIGSITTRAHHSLLEPPDSFLVSYYGQSDASSTSRPMGTVTTRDRHALVTADEPARDIDVDDCRFRMLEPHEVGRAMAFPSDYTVLGNKRDRVRQYGNAVTPPVMAQILERCIATLR